MLVPDTSDTSAKRMRHATATRVQRERHECDTSEQILF